MTQKQWLGVITIDPIGEAVQINNVFTSDFDITASFDASDGYAHIQLGEPAMDDTCLAAFVSPPTIDGKTELKVIDRGNFVIRGDGRMGLQIFTLAE